MPTLKDRKAARYTFKKNRAKESDLIKGDLNALEQKKTELETQIEALRVKHTEALEQEKSETPPVPPPIPEAKPKRTRKK